jgi:hypothetical protein
MTYFSESAKKEFVDAAKSDRLRQEFDSIRKNRVIMTGDDITNSVESYIDFVTQYNRFINHRPKQVVKITGKNWKL